MHFVQSSTGSDSVWSFLGGGVGTNKKMGDFYMLWKGKATVVDELRQRLDEASSAFDLEQQSVISIQKLFRGAFIRDKFAVQRAACIQITRVFRGHRSRIAFSKKVEELAQTESMAVYHYHAVVVQRAFRGFYSRRYYHDYRFGVVFSVFSVLFFQIKHLNNKYVFPIQFSI